MNLRKREQTGLPLLIAEVGFNHEGSLDQARTMIRTAAASGADAVKFQTFRAADLALPTAPHFELIRSAEMSPEQARALADTAREAGIAFFSTPFSLDAVAMLEAVGVPAYKVASMDLATPYLLDAVARTGKPIILSTGMATLDETGTAIDRLRRAGATDIALLHCLSLYPAEAGDCNLAAIGELKRAFGLPTGWSDHYPGSSACLAAFCVGADIIETHFTLDTATPGGDHGHSLDPAGMQALVDEMRRMAPMFGGQDFFDRRPDRQHAAAYRRGVYAARDIAPGETLTMADLLFCRPESELTPRTVEAVLGRRVVRPLTAHAPLSLGDVDGRNA